MRQTRKSRTRRRFMTYDAVCASVCRYVVRPKSGGITVVRRKTGISVRLPCGSRRDRACFSPQQRPARHLKPHSSLPCTPLLPILLRFRSHSPDVFAFRYAASSGDNADVSGVPCRVRRQIRRAVLTFIQSRRAAYAARKASEMLSIVPVVTPSRRSFYAVRSVRCAPQALLQPQDTPARLWNACHDSIQARRSRALRSI